MFRPVKIALVTAATAVLAYLGSGFANAATLYIDEVQYGVKQPTAIAECRADHSTCQIAAGKTIGASITAGLGVTVGALNASMQTQYQETYTVTTSCTSPVLKPGQVYVMFPRGDFVFFRVDDRKGTAFLPTGVFCEIHDDWRGISQWLTDVAELRQLL